MVGTDDFEDLFQPRWFYDLIILSFYDQEKKMQIFFLQPKQHLGPEGERPQQV